MVLNLLMGDDDKPRKKNETPAPPAPPVAAPAPPTPPVAEPPVVVNPPAA